MKTIEIIPENVCADAITIKYDENSNIILDVEILGGCPGNGIAISKLLIGLKLEKVTELLDGIGCGSNVTSCADQLAKGIKEHLAS